MKAALITLLLLVGAALLALYLGQRKLIFPAPTTPPPEVLPIGIELIELKAGRAFLALPNQSSGPAPLLVYAHGNGEVAHRSLNYFEYFRDRGIAVLLLEYPGYGGAPGSPSAHSILDAALEALDQVVTRTDIDASKVISYGRSIGGGVASQLAVNRDFAALILESTFSSLSAIVAESGYPAFLLRDKFDNAAAVSTLDIPVFLYHGTRDQIIGHHHSEKLAALAKRAKLLKADCGHNGCPRPWAEIFAFLQAEDIIHVRTLGTNPEVGLDD